LVSNLHFSLEFRPKNSSDRGKYFSSLTRGWTNTQRALEMARTSDIPTGRDLGKNKTIVFVFTDGESNIQQQQTIPNANLLKKVATVHRKKFEIFLIPKFYRKNFKKFDFSIFFFQISFVNNVEKSLEICQKIETFLKFELFPQI